MSKKIAPALSTLAKARWNFMDSPDSTDLVGGEYAQAEAAMWDSATVELRALLAVDRAVRKEHQFCPTFEKCPVCRALARLDRLSSGTGKRKGGTR